MHGIPAEVPATELSPELLAECAPRELTELELRTRRDFRSECVFSIDPATAKDLDDALHIRRCEDGSGYEVGVHIADLSEFVKPGSLLEEHAGTRGTTTYLPHINLPMVPRQLSENLCSLRGGVDRRTISVVVQLDSSGQLQAGTAPWFGLSIVRSRGKVPYGVAQDVLDAQRAHVAADSKMGGEICRGELQVAEDAVWVGCGIAALHNLAAQMRARRLRSCEAASVMPGDDRNNDGVFWLDRESGRVQIKPAPPAAVASPSADDGAGLVSWSGQESHQLVEEFMLLANRLVAEKLSSALDSVGGGALLRGQLPPSLARLKSWCVLSVEQGGYAHGFSELDASTIPKAVCSLLSQLRLVAEQQPATEAAMVAEALRWVATRTNTSATYVHTECMGADAASERQLAEADRRRHYSLGFDRYTHFTSPIRRYADLLVHRLLRAVLTAEEQGGAGDAGHLEEALAKQGVGRARMVGLVQRTNQQARGAKYAQQDCERLLALRYVSESGGSEGLIESAVVVSVDESGARVLLPRLDLEHIVRARDLKCLATWDDGAKKLRVFPNAPAGPRGGGRQQRSSPAKAQAEGVEEGEPVVVDVGQLSVLRVRVRATFDNRSPRAPSLSIEFLPEGQ